MVKKRMPNIELARIIGCFVVVCVHTVTWYEAGGELLKNSLFLRCFFTDGVSIFWYIMGYFLFSNPNTTLEKRLKKTGTQLLLPAFAVMVFSQIWQDWVLADIGQVSFLSCLDMHSFDFKNLFGNILSWKADMTFGGHFWYIFTYVEVILWTPLLAFVCTEDPRATKCRRFLMLLSILYVINQDVKNAVLLSGAAETYPVKIFSVITPTLLFVLIGYEISIHKELIKKHASWLKWCGFVGFFAFNLLKYVGSVRFMSVDPWDSYFLGISTVWGYLASLSIFVGVLALSFNAESGISGIIRNIGSTTLGIYLIHGLVFRKMNAVGIRDWFYTLMKNHPDNLLAETVCTIAYAVAVFIVCYLIIMILRGLKILVKGLYLRVKQHNSKVIAIAE